MRLFLGRWGALKRDVSNLVEKQKNTRTDFRVEWNPFKNDIVLFRNLHYGSRDQGFYGGSRYSLLVSMHRQP